MRIWGLRGLILFFRQASARLFSLASHGFKTVVIFKKMIPPCVSVFLMDVRAMIALLMAAIERSGDTYDESSAE